MSKILIDNATILTMNSSGDLIGNGAIAIDGNRVTAIGPSQSIPRDIEYDRVIDCDGNPVLPGFVNAHNHLIQPLIKGSRVVHEADLFQFLEYIYLVLTKHAGPEDSYYAALGAALENIRTGCTCTIDCNNLPSLDNAEAVLRALNDIGMRGIEGPLLADQDLSNLGFPIIEDIDKQLEQIVALSEKWANNERLGVCLQPSWPLVCSDELIEKIAACSAKHGLMVSFHLHEDKEEISDWVKQTGRSPIQHYQALMPQLLGERLLGNHCVWVDEEDIRILGETGSHVSHNPVSNSYAAGIAPVPEMLKAGVNISLGTDGYHQDYFETLLFAALVHKLPSGDPGVISAEKVLEMATIGGARALGLDDQIGSLEVGKKADLVIYDLKQANTTPIFDSLAATIVYQAKSHNVDTVLINGEVVMEKKEILTIDEMQTLSEIQKSRDRVFSDTSAFS